MHFEQGRLGKKISGTDSQGMDRPYRWTPVTGATTSGRPLTYAGNPDYQGIVQTDGFSGYDFYDRQAGVKK